MQDLTNTPAFIKWQWLALWEWGEAGLTFTQASLHFIVCWPWDISGQIWGRVLLLHHFFVCLSCIEFDLSGPPHIWTEKMMEKLSEKNKNRFLKGGLRSCTLSCFQLERLRKHQEHHSDSDFQAKGFSDVYRAYRDQTSSSNKLQVKHSSGLLVSQLPLSDVKLAPAKLDCFGLPTVSQLFFFVLTEPLALIDKLY